MSHIDISSDEHDNNKIESDESVNGTTGNMSNFQQMIKMCKKNKSFPQDYIDNMNNMYKKCNDKQRSSKKLCSLILKGIENITMKSENSFQFAADVYNELLQLSKNDHSKIENNVASTSKGFSNKNNELESETKKISLSNKIFNEFIEKCYQNINFPHANIQAVDKLYKSLAPEFVESNHFVLLLKEANQAIWPDSGVSLYIHVEHVYNQLLQFHTSMKVQDKKELKEDNKTDKKKLIKLQKLKIALKKIRKHIKILDEKEMNINDEDQFDSDSPYILKDKLEKKIVEIYKRICDLTDEPNFLDEPRIHFNKTSNKLVNSTIETYYNQNKEFPSYFDIYTLLKVLQKKKKLNWTETQLKSISHDAFLKLGKQLKVKRLNEYFGRLAHEITEKDPAEDDLELKKKLDESKKKLNAELNAITEEFNNKQDYVVKTEDSGSSNDTNNELSSEDELISKNQYHNKKFKTTNTIPVKRKRQLSNNTENDEINTISSDDESIDNSQHCNKKLKTTNITSIKCKKQLLCNTKNDESNIILSEDESINNSQHCNKKLKTTNTISVSCKKQISNNTVNEEVSTKNRKSILMDKLDLIPCVVKLNKLNILSHQKTTLENNKVPDEIVKEKSNNVNNTSNCGHIQKINNSDGNVPNSNVVKGKSISNNEEHVIIIADIHGKNKIDEIIKNKQLTNEIREDKTNDTNVNTKTTDGEQNYIDNDPSINNDFIIMEPEVTLVEEIQPKDVIEINDHDDSDVEITSCDSPKVPVKPNLESIIKAMNFDKQYNWDPHIPRPNHSNSVPSRESQHHRSGNPTSSSLNLNPTLVNRWVMNNTHNVQPPRPKNPRLTNNTRQINPNINKQHQINPRMQSTSMVQKSMTQKGKNVTQHTQTTVQNRHHFSNNRSLVQQKTTTMTTTTMVQHIVHQTQLSHQRIDPSKHRLRDSVSRTSHLTNNNCKPELIELD